MRLKGVFLKFGSVAIIVNIVIFTILVFKITPNEEIPSFTRKSASKESYANISQELNANSINLSSSFPEVPPIQDNLISFVHTPSELCGNLTDPAILIVVHSAIINFKNRQVLRNTLGKHHTYNELATRIVFVIGMSNSRSEMRQLSQEYSAHGDILTIAVPDRYTLLVYKSVGWMKWLVSSCVDVKHIIKIDDDTFLNMFKISDLFRTCSTILPNSSSVCKKMSCFLWRNFKPHRKGKYRLSVSEYSRDRFPPFCPGLVIFIPGSLVPRLLEATKHVQFLWLDDVYLTGLLIEYLGEAHYNFGKKIMDPLKKTYEDVDSGKVLVAHFKDDVKNGVYQEHWNKIEKL